VKFFEAESYQPLARELFRDRLNADANLRSAYDELKRQASELDEDGYRNAKSEFIESVLRMVNRRPALFETAHFIAGLLSPADLGLVIQLNSECSDFYFLQNGQSPNEADARELFEQVPAQCDPSMKLPIGLFDPQKTLIGVLEVLRGYRTASDWYIGLMLLSPRFRGQGLGAEIHNEFVAHARQAGVRRLMLAVLEANDAGRRFWLRCGYRKIKDYPPRQSGRRFHSLSEFEFVIAACNEGH
jgi:RimJ/RimL family protein N-acetyltransferase